MKINLSDGKKYLSQLNNKISPMSTCNTTSAIMALEVSNISYSIPDGWEQPEDYLTSILHSEGSYQRMKEKYPWAVRDGYEPNEVHGMLEWGINKLVGRQVDTFITSASINQMINNLFYNRKAVLVSGKFTATGHIVCVVGFSSIQTEEDFLVNGFDPREIEYFIIDDPYGDWHTGYKNRNGDNVKLSFDEFNDLTKSYHMPNNKWMHIFS